LGPKRLELLREFLPAGASIAVLVNLANGVGAAEAKEVQAAASLLGLRLSILNVSSLIEVDAAFASLDHQVVSGLLIINDVSFFQWRAHIVALAARKPIPAIFADRLFAEAGGLMSYGTDIPDGYRLTGVYTGRILKGEKPADLPVQLSNKFEFILNLKTAKALGLTVPQSILLRADEVIE
jgi:putative ABC transport system substrate-binding protein